MKIEQTEYAGFPALRLSTGHWSAICIPDLGGHIPEFTHAATGRQWLWINPFVPLARHEYGFPFPQAGGCGIDECFPAVAAGPYPLEPYAGVQVPDHGEVWPLPWRMLDAEGALHTLVEGPALPYSFERILSEAPGEGDAGSGLLFTYRVTNLGNAPLLYSWSSHPVFAAEPGMRVLVEPEARYSVYWTRAHRYLADTEPASWHDAGEGEEAELLPVYGPDSPQAVKLFFEGLRRNWVGLYHPESHSHLRIAYSHLAINTVGYYMNLGEAPGADHLALEPCIGNRDALHECLATGTARTLAPGEQHTWSWSLSPGTGLPGGHER